MRLSCTIFEILSLIFQKLTRSRDNWPRSFQRQFVVRGMELAMVNIHTKFKVSSLGVSHSRDILAGLKFKMGHVTWPRPFQGRFVICYVQPTYQTWSVYDYLQRRYERQRQNVKILLLSHYLGDLEVTHRFQLLLDGKHIVNFLSVIIVLFR